VVRRRFSSDEDRRSWIADGHGILTAHLQTIGVPTTGVPFVRVHPDRPGTVAVEAGVPVAERITPKDEVAPATLPGGPCAVAWHDGPPETADPAREAVAAWLERQGVEPVGPPWEHHHVDPSGAAPQTQVVQPYRP
jgi:effector-binding domain-containing protein